MAKSKPRKPRLTPVPARKPEDLREIALGIVERRIFTHRHINEGELNQMMLTVFMPLALGGLKGVDLKSLGMVFGRMDNSARRISVNGYPVFGACELLNVEDAATVLRLAREMKEAIDKIGKGEPQCPATADIPTVPQTTPTAKSRSKRSSPKTTS